jgi:hypothetical protein
MSFYQISKSRTKGNWNLNHVGTGRITPLGSFPKRKQALTTARLLAGRNGKVVVK